MHTDSCSPQYKCRKDFVTIAKSCRKPCGTTIIHKISQKYSFKGSWDATGMLVKQAINHLDICGNCCANKNNCYQCLIKESTKDGDEKKTKNVTCNQVIAHVYLALLQKSLNWGARKSFQKFPTNNSDIINEKPILQNINVECLFVCLFVSKISPFVPIFCTYA